MAVWREVHRAQTTNSAAVTAGSTTEFGVATADREAKSKHGSFNKASVNILETQGAIIRLDGLTSRQYEMSSPGSFEIHPEEGLFFDWLQVEAIAEIAAGDIQGGIAIAKRVEDADD
jgi:hypothetical protein